MEWPTCVPASVGAHFWVFTATLWILQYFFCVFPNSPLKQLCCSNLVPRSFFLLLLFVRFFVFFFIVIIVCTNVNNIWVTCIDLITPENKSNKMDLFSSARCAEVLKSLMCSEKLSNKLTKAVIGLFEFDCRPFVSPPPKTIRAIHLPHHSLSSPPIFDLDPSSHRPTCRSWRQTSRPWPGFKPDPHTSGGSGERVCVRVCVCGKKSHLMRRKPRPSVSGTCRHPADVSVPQTCSTGGGWALHDDGHKHWRLAVGISTSKALGGKSKVTLCVRESECLCWIQRRSAQVFPLQLECNRGGSRLSTRSFSAL